jgi:Domain of unknown function (DUF4288)
MNWYVAKIVFQIASASERTVAQFDEHLRLVYADSFEQAFRKARLIGIQEEDQAPEVGGGVGCRGFVNIAALYPLDSLSDGSSLYSRIHETREAKAYITLVHRKAAELAA